MSKPHVLIYKETLLPLSETFILAQMGALRAYTSRLIGLERVQPSLPLPAEPILLSTDAGRRASLRAKVYRRLAVDPAFHAKARAEHASLLHAHFASGGLSAIALARALDLPLLVTLHGADITVRRDDAHIRRLANHVDQFICVSHFIRDRALAAGLPASKLLVHYIGVDLEQFRNLTSASPEGGVLFVGRLVQKKGCETLIRAMQIVQQSAPQRELTIIGDGPLRPALESLSRELGVRCSFAGSQPSLVVREHLSRARVFCAPSEQAADGDSEGLGIVFAEAQAMGVPVVSTLHGGIPEVVANGSTGILVPERQPRALAEALLLLLSNDDLWNNLRRNAPIHIQRSFDLVAQTAKLEQIYAELISRRASTPAATPVKSAAC